MGGSRRAADVARAARAVNLGGSTDRLSLGKESRYMRKDVKLGMAIGGGLIALLVGYLLLGPAANNNKKGTQLAAGGNGGATSIIDPGDGTGGDALGAPGPDAANQNTGS